MTPDELATLDRLVREYFENAGVLVDEWAVVATENTQTRHEVHVVASPRPMDPNPPTLVGMFTIAAHKAERGDYS